MIPWVFQTWQAAVLWSDIYLADETSQRKLASVYRKDMESYINTLNNHGEQKSKPERTKN